MNNNEIITQLQGVVSALNQVSCSGMQNHLNLVASINTINSMIAQLDKNNNQSFFIKTPEAQKAK